ncbi:18929_t:CDS:2 [Funneliformis geosporum]|uniref:18929_t:CDS:1 n=1 Tax=Funneliformis geosporum TaxID=1117311 RepID=A0A9W4WRV5_9GLOM|nr:18929_t:CDS:2 [Funneliformis geosporum]
MHKHRTNKFRIFIEDSSSSQEENKETARSENIMKSEEKETNEFQEEKEGGRESEEEKPKSLKLYHRLKNYSSQGKKIKMNDNTSEECNNNSEDNLLKTIQNNGISRKFKRIHNKQSDGSKHKGKGVIENFWINDYDLEGSIEESEMEVDHRENDDSGASGRDYIIMCKRNEEEDEEMKDAESHVHLKLSHDQIFHPYRLDNRIRMIEQTLQRTTWKEHLSETRINRLEAKNYKLKQEYKQLRKQLRRQRRKEKDDDDSSRSVNPDQIQNPAGEYSNERIGFDYGVFVAGLVGFGLGGLVSHYL